MEGPLARVCTVYSLVPRPTPSFSMLHSEICISACNIEKLGVGLGTRLYCMLIEPINRGPLACVTM